MSGNEQEGKKGMHIIEWIKLIGYVASILVASTTLLSLSGYVPSWWFHFALIVLIGLIFSIPLVVFSKSISKRIKTFRLTRERNAIAAKKFDEFKMLMDTCRGFDQAIENLFNNLTSSHDSQESSLITYILKSYEKENIRYTFYFIGKEIEESDKSFRDLYFLTKHLEFALNIYERNLKFMEEFVHEIKDFKGKKISKGIEEDFEVFREKFNDFLKDFKDYCRQINQELRERKFPEWIIDHIKKW